MHAVAGCRVVEPLEHQLRDVDGDQLPNPRRECKSEQAGARAEVDDVVVPPGLGELDDAVSDRKKGGARGHFLPGLHALVPPVRILSHPAYVSRAG